MSWMNEDVMTMVYGTICDYAELFIMRMINYIVSPLLSHPLTIVRLQRY